MKKKKNVVITGALGQDGIILSKLLIKKKYNIYGVVKKLNKKKIKGVNYSTVNILDYRRFSNYIKKVKPHALLHLGTENPNYLELKKKKDFYKKNLKTTKNLIDYFSKYFPNKKLILIGSSQMYDPSSKKVNLNSEFNPGNSYARFRVESYNYMVKRKKIDNSKMITAILFNHDSSFRKKKFLIPRLIKLIKLKNFNKLDEIYETNVSADFSHAEDICYGLYKLMISKYSPDKLIFSSNKRTYINDIIYLLLKKNKIKYNFTNKVKNNSSTPIGDNKFTSRLLNWSHKKNIFVAAKELNLKF
tara:strand:- start:861 stop:1766 length:906 start_codon:yes stop_codon:yes gene_type:complete